MGKKPLPEKILENYLNSYPCKDCEKFKKYQREMNSWNAALGGYAGLDHDGKKVIHHIHSLFILHIKEKHLPSEKEWEVLEK